MQRLGACNFLKCSSYTLIPINYVMWSKIYSPSLPTILEAYAKKYKFKQQAKTHKCNENDYIAKSAVHCTTGSLLHISENQYKKAVLPQGNRAMPQVFFSVEVRQQHSLQAKLRKRHASELQTCWRKTQFNTKSGFKVNQSHVFGVSGKTVRQY